MTRMSSWQILVRRYCFGSRTINCSIPMLFLIVVCFFVPIHSSGFARKCDDSANDGQGSLRTACGSQMYVAPEILSNNPYGTKADMWSLGVIVFILLSGYPPFVDDDTKSLFRMIRHATYEFHPDYWDGISDDAKNLVKGLLTVDPKERLSSKQVLGSRWTFGEWDQSMASYDVMEPNFAKLKRFHTASTDEGSEV